MVTLTDVEKRAEEIDDELRQTVYPSMIELPSELKYDTEEYEKLLHQLS